MHDDQSAPGPEGLAASGSDEAVLASSPRAATRGARWGEPIVAADRFWTRFEISLAVVAFVLEATSMLLWVCLKGFAAPADHVSSLVFRAIVGATVLGTTAHWVFGRVASRVREAATLVAVFLGFFAARAWLHVGQDYSANLLNWYQQASFLTLVGGLRGVGTRLTMLLALVGGSLATARGRHIVIDVLTRFVSARARTAMVLTGWLASAAACLITAWGFFDHIAIDSFGANADAAWTRKVDQVAAQLGEDFFIARKQIALDLKSTAHVVVRGETYSDWLTGNEWNAWVDSAGFEERYGREATEAVKIPQADTRAPLVIVPGRGEPRGELINAAYLVFPIGLVIIAARFLVRGLLVLSGHASTESDEADDFREHGRSEEEHGDAPAP
jgi:TRAP-type C4-dicarboxylate transport system permease small subunit